MVHWRVAAALILVICYFAGKSNDLLQTVQAKKPKWTFSGPPVVSGHGHGHSHDHDHDENPSFKYSRQANIQEDEIMEEDIVDLPPQHAKAKPNQHGHGHAHSHSHGGHGHGHSHGGHGHSHGPPQRELSPEEREAARKRLHKNWDDDDEEEPG